MSATTKKETQPENLISFAGFAKRKNVGRNNVQNWIKAGLITPTETADGKMIDLTLYSDFDPAEIKRGAPLRNRGIEIKLRDLEKRVKVLEGRLNVTE